MTKSLMETTTALVRVELGMSQTDFAKLIGKSWPTIQAIEQKKLLLSEKTALEIARKTGVSAEWLLRGDVNEPPVDGDGKPWNLARFDQHIIAYALERKIKRQGGSKSDAEKMARALLGDDVAGDLMKVLRKLASDPDRFMLALSKARRLVDELEKGA